jgi:soluble lytic murein transglycosylase
MIHGVSLPGAAVATLLAIALSAVIGDAPVLAKGGTSLSAKDLEPPWTTAEMQRILGSARNGEWDAVRQGLLALTSDRRKLEHNERLRFLLGHACVRSRDWLCAATVLEGLEKEVPLMAGRILFLRGSALAGLGRNDEAVSALAGVPDGEAVSGDALVLMADTLSALGRSGEAADAWQRLVDGGRRDPESVGKLAANLLAAGRRDSAVDLVRKAYFRSAASGRRGFRIFLEGLGVRLEASPTESLDHAQALLDSHRSEQVVTEVKTLVAHADPAVRCRALTIRGGAYTKLRKHGDALADFRRVLDGCRDHSDMARTLFVATRAAFRSGQPDEADRYADRLRREYPDATFNDDVSVMRARIAVSKGQEATATRILQDSVKAWPDGDMADESRWLIAWAAFRARNYKEALERVREGMKATTDPDYVSRFAYWEGRILELTRRGKEARAAYESCVRRFPMRYHGILALNRLSGMEKGAQLQGMLDRLIPGDSRGQRFLTLSAPDALKQGAVARALWLARTGLPEQAAAEVARGASGGTSDDGWIAALVLDHGGQFTRSHRLAASLLKDDAFWPNDASSGYFRLAYPRPWMDLVTAAARESGIEPALIHGIMREESAFIAGVESRANAMGLMQLIMPTAKSMAKDLKLTASPESLRRPEVNIRLGAAYLSRLMKRFGNPLLAIPGYNAGGGAISKGLTSRPGIPLDEFVETIGAEETRNYARKVFESYAAYRYIYGTGPGRFTRVDFNR